MKSSSRWTESISHACAQHPHFIVLTYTSSPRIEQLARKSGKRLRVVDDRSAYLPIKKDVMNADALHEVLKSLVAARLMVCL